MPIRIQCKRTKGWKIPPNTIYVGRPSKWGNPFHIGDRITTIKTRNNGATLTTRKVRTRKESLTAYAIWIQQKNYNWDIDLSELKGKDLACWCPLDKPCHADILLKLANENTLQTL